MEKLIVSILYLILIIVNLLVGTESLTSEEESEQMLDRLECYRCLHDPYDGNRPVCDVEYKPGTLFLLNSSVSPKRAEKPNNSMWDDDFEEDDADEFDEDEDEFIEQPDVIKNNLPLLDVDDDSGLKLNPCFLVAGKVLDMVDEEQLAFYNNIDTERPPDLPILKSEITAVQFQNGKNAIFAEVQLNGGIDVFTFLITDPIVRIMVPEGSWYYGAF